MRKLHIVFALLLVLLLSACGQDDATGTSSQSEGAAADNVIKIGATPDGYPQIYMEDDEVKGFGVDVYEAIFDKLGYELEWVITDWTGALASMETGKIDTLGNFAVTPEREEKYNFTDPYYYSRVALGVAENNESIKSLEDAKGKQVANVLGANYENVVKEYDPNDEIEIVNYEAFDVIFQDVASGKVDAMVTGREMLLAQVKDKGIPLKVVEETFGEKLVAFPFEKNEENDKLIADINKTVEELRTDGTLEELSMEWFGEDVTVSSQETE